VEKASNWTEREADDVGAEIYYRAGFSPDKVSNFLTVAAHQSLADSDGITTKECMAFANSRSLSDLDDILHSKVDRGDGTHPKPCWRLIHLIYEKELHRNDIASLNPPTGVEAKFEKLLQESKDEIAKNSFYK
jgi:hypothetical protein